MMQVEIRELEPQKAVCVEHRGPYHQIGKAFGEIAQWTRETGLAADTFVGLYYDDPRFTPEAELRSAAGAIVPGGFATDDPRVRVVDVPGGTCAVATHVGAYEGLPAAWAQLMGEWLPASGYEPVCAPSLEIYPDDCAVVPEDKLRTELRVPVQPRAS
jgi:AraC family transcriptional regulator